jgi:8-oxo-dGTP diphosphatase
LRRELAEELPGLELNRYFLWTKVKGKTSQSRKKMNDAVFLGQVDGKLTIGDPKEIDKAAWRKPWRLRLTATSRYIRDRLLQEGHIKR